jgi:beta-glucosidase
MDSFIWGVSTSAYQIEGGHNADGKGESIWDRFTNHSKNKIFNKHNANIACDHYNKYEEDILILKSLGIKHYRFSLSWARIIPDGVGDVNWGGIDFYNRLIDTCLKNEITPWVTLYHWDLPQKLEDIGGWTNRSIINHFVFYVSVCLKYFGDRVKNWMVMNEPTVFVGAGYFLGIHAPGKKGFKNFLPAIHHVVLSICEGARYIRSFDSSMNIGCTFSFSYVEPYKNSIRDIAASKRVDALLNRLFLEPILGLGYPVLDLEPLKDIHQYIQLGDEDKMYFDFDFIGVQNYTREIISHSWFVPYIKAKIIKPTKRNVQFTQMDWEVYPPSIYHILKKVAEYKGVKNILVTENGAAFEDNFSDELINDIDRTNFIRDHINEVMKAKAEGVPVTGYFVWTLMDNFEWAEGYRPRFGLIYVDYKSQKRIFKKSALWYSERIN